MDIPYCTEEGRDLKGATVGEENWGDLSICPQHFIGRVSLAKETYIIGQPMKRHENASVLC